MSSQPVPARHVAGPPRRNPRPRNPRHLALGTARRAGQHTADRRRAATGDTRWRHLTTDNRIVLIIGVLASLGLIWGGTTAAFTSTTPSGNNSWSTGTVTLSDDDGGSALFTASGLVPGSSGSNCITVTYTGTVPTTVRLYASASSDASSVASYLDLTIQEGNGGNFGNCTGFTAATTLYTGTLATFTSSKTSYATGTGTWAPITAASRVYKVSYTLNSATPNTKQGAITTATLQWEAQS